jgi:hypothetical protein
MPTMIVPAGQFRSNAATFLAEFSSSLRTGVPFGIMRVFSLFPLNPVYRETIKSFVERGSIQVSILKTANGLIEGLLKNEGPFFDAPFHDETPEGIGDVIIFCPASLAATFSVSPRSVNVVMTAPGNGGGGGTEALVTLVDRPAPNRFIFRAVEFQNDRFTYTFSEDGHRDHAFTIITDFTRSVSPGESLLSKSEISPGTDFRTMSLMMTSGEGGCFVGGCGHAEPTGDPNKYYVCRFSDGNCLVRKGGCGYGYVAEVAHFDTEKEAADFIKEGGCKQS